MPTIVRRNERSWAISMISDINIKLQNMGLRIVRAGGESTISTGHSSMFPDVLLYGDENQTQILQGWELKLPDTPITDTTFIEDAKRKARSLGLNSCFIWNFTAGVLYVKNDNDEFEIVRQWNETNHIQTREDVERYKHEWLPIIEQILIEINGFLVTGAIRGTEIGEFLSDTIISKIIERNKTLVSTELHNAAVVDTRIEAFLSVWWNEVQIEYTYDEANMYDAYAKAILLNWTNRIIFAHLIKSRHNAAMAVEELDFDSEIDDANDIFQDITTACDFFNIFNAIEHNSHIPSDTWHDLMDLNVFLKDNGLRQIEQTTLQNVLEKTVAVAKRELNGQFTTPSTLAELLVCITTLDWSGNSIDPCCGTGAIPKAILSHKKDRLRNIEEAVNTTWAEDKFSLPLQLATISMTNVDSINIPNKVFQGNVFVLREGNAINITNPTNGEIMTFHIPKFDTVASNLPFIPFEKISDDDWRYIRTISSNVLSHTGITLSDRSDYYSYILFSLYENVARNGRLGIITSNSWLGTTAGKEFFRALGFFYKIEQIHITDTERWFNNAQVVTIVTILSKKEQITPPTDNEQTAFCIWHKKLSEINEDISIRDAIINSALLNRELNNRIMSYKPYSNAEITALTNMNVSLSALFHDIRWLLEIREKLCPISTVFDVVRGERRGWDTMFYPAHGHGIEEVYIKKVLKNARNIDTLRAEADNDAFCCSLSLEELREQGHQGALSWIARFQNGVNKVGKPLIQSLARRNMHWYEMTATNTADIVTTMNPDRRLFFAKFDESTFINQRLIGLKKKDGYEEVALYHALLNSILGMFYIEAVGFGRGLGALDISSTTIRNAFMLNPQLLSDENKGSILNAFEPLLNRDVEYTSVELTLEDRRNFDMTVLRAYGIEEHYESIKQSLLSMQKMRLSVRQ